MKKVLIIFLLWFIPNVVNAECINNLRDLDILGIKLSPDFDRYQNLYSVILNEEDSLPITYEKESSEAIVLIKNNESLEDKDIVSINVYCDNNVNTYEIMVNKSSNTPVFEEIKGETFTKKNYFITMIYVGIPYLIILIIIGFILFKKKQKRL